MEGQVKGTVTPLSSMFSSQDSQKAVHRVQEAIAEKKKELDHLKGFIADNSNLINLVQRLPDDLHHDIMVPFGNAAFFPGRLVHTNELMVLLGEGYYAERSARQTVEIMKRREKTLDSQVDSLKANIHDLEAEASFFDTAAAEAAEGLVEIREDYVEQCVSATQSKSDKSKDGVEDEEYNRIMSRLDELEKEEELAEGEGASEEGKEEELAEGSEEGDEADETTDADEVIIDTEDDDDDDDDDDEQTSAYESENDNHTSFVGSGNQIFEEDRHTTKVDSDDYSNRTNRSRKVTFLEESIGGKPMVTNRADDVISDEFQSKIDFSSRSNSTGLTRHSARKGPEQASKSGFDSRKAFTGSIMERTDNLRGPIIPSSPLPSPDTTEPSKPVSRYKMQRRGR